MFYDLINGSGCEGDKLKDRMRVNMFAETLYDLINEYDQVVTEQNPIKKVLCQLSVNSIIGNMRENYQH